MKYITTVDGVDYEVEILERNKIRVNDKEYKIDFDAISGQGIYTLLVNGKSFEAYVSEDEDIWNVLMLGNRYKIDVVDLL